MAPVAMGREGRSYAEIVASGDPSFTPLSVDKMGLVQCHARARLWMVGVIVPTILEAIFLNLFFWMAGPGGDASCPLLPMSYGTTKQHPQLKLQPHDKSNSIAQGHSGSYHVSF